MIKKVLLYLVIFLLPVSFLFGQSFVFQKNFKTGGLNHAISIVSCSDTGTIFSSMVRPSSSSNHQEINLTKFDKYGNISWSKEYGDGLNTDWLYNPIRTIDNGFFGIGQHFGAVTGAGSGEMLAFKIDSVGNIVWVKLIGTSRNEFGIRSIELPDSSLILLGGSDGAGNNDRDFLLVRLDFYGNLISSKYYGDTLYDDGEMVALTENGGIMLCGYKRNSGVTQPDIFLVRLDSIGNILWSKTYGTSNYEVPITITPTLDNGFLILGRTFIGSSWKGLSIKIDASGNILWSKTYDKSGAYLSFQTCIQQPDSTFQLSGNTSGAFLAKMDSIGDLIWFNIYNNVIGSDCSVNENGDISFATVKGSFDTLVFVRTDPNGNSCNQNTSPVNVVNISLTTNNVITYSGDTGVIANYNIPVAAYTPYHQFDCITTSIYLQEEVNNNIDIFPNPSRGNISIIFNDEVKNREVNIFNLYGEIVFKKNNLYEAEMDINLKYLPSGIYFVKAFDDEKSYCKKIIIERD